MIRVLHLFCRPSTFQTEHGVSLLSDPTAGGFHSATLTIGRGGDFRSALGAAANLRFGHSGFELVHAWDARSFIAAVASGLPVIFSPPGRFRRGTWSWLATSAYHDVHVVSPTRWGCDAQVREGLARERCHVIVPGYETAGRPAGVDAGLRARLGILPSQFVILAPGESSRSARHRVAWHAAAILRVLDDRFRMLIWGRGPEARLIRDLSAKVKQPDLVIEAEKRLGHEVSLDELAGAADVALFTGSSDASTLPLAVCASAGLPIVATESAALGELWGGQGLVVLPRKDVRTLAQTILELQEDPGRRAVLGNAARARAGEIFDPGRFVREYGELYQRVAAHRGATVGGSRERVEAANATLAVDSRA